jgi:hypothetical protein
MSTTTTQTTLLTAHKGVDLHAASALLVMRDRLEGGERLANLLRCELHTFWGEPEGVTVQRLLDTGRYFNPNKHHFGVFGFAGEGVPWLAGHASRGRELPAGWPGQVVKTDLAEASENLYQRLLGGVPAPGHTVVDVISFELDQAGPVLSGVLWRLVLTGDPETAQQVGHDLAVARTRKQGLLINPHMEAWLSVPQETK